MGDEELPDWVQVGVYVDVLTQGQLLSDRVDRGEVEHIGSRAVLVRVGREIYRFRRPALRRRTSVSAFDVRQSVMLDKGDSRSSIVPLRAAIQNARNELDAWAEKPEDDQLREVALEAVRLARQEAAGERDSPAG